MARVLVVDDDPDILNLVQMQLRRHGHQTAGACSAEEALDLLDAKGAPDVAVLDVAMPQVSGLELLKIMRTREGLGSVPVIFLSARVSPDDVEAGRALGAIYLTKPFVASALIAAIDRSLPAAAGW